MRRLGRKGRVLKWTGLVLSMLIAVAWVLSGFRDVLASSRTHRVALHDGALWYCGHHLRPGFSITFEGGRGGQYWTSCSMAVFDFGAGFTDPEDGQMYRARVIPLWAPFLMAVAPTVYLFWCDRRFSPGRCQHCGYDLTGNISGTCPECGVAVPDGNSANAQRGTGLWQAIVAVAWKKLVIIFTMLGLTWLTLGLTGIVAATCLGDGSEYLYYWCTLRRFAVVGSTEIPMECVVFTWQSVSTCFGVEQGPAGKQFWTFLGVTYLHWSNSGSAGMGIYVEWLPGTLLFLTPLAASAVWNRCSRKWSR